MRVRERQGFCRFTWQRGEEEAAKMDFQELIWKLGIEPSHYDGMGRNCQPSWETLHRILGSLGLEVDAGEDLPALLENLQEAQRSRLLEPVIVKWEGRETRIEVNLAAGCECSTAVLIARSEDGEEFLFRQEVTAGAGVSASFACPEELGNGYYEVEVEAGGKHGTALLIAAPYQAYRGKENERIWGLFCPLYALHSSGSMGSGDFTALEECVSWMSEKGGGILGTLPLFSAFLDDPCEPSPYAPVSRLFWNEFYVDPHRAVNWETCAPARALYESKPFQASLDSLNGSPRVDLYEQMKLRRSLLEVLAEDFFAESGTEGGLGRRVLKGYLEAEPEILKYARFRAAREQERMGGMDRDFFVGAEGRAEARDDLLEYHLYVQWLAHEQMNHLREHAGSQGVDLYMDLPLGVHPDGYDASAYSDFFANGVSGGAPPDDFFTAGQDWGFRPMHPWKSREMGHSYFRRIVRNLMNFSNVIRLDHVMNLHRLYWVPLGLPADQGAYVRYPSEELYAILMLESHKRQCVIVGEDLGTVPPEVRENMQEHGILRMYVGQFEVNPRDQPRLHEPSDFMAASINTHDTPTFSGFSKSLDIYERVDLGILRESEVQGEREERDSVLRCLAEDLGLQFPGEGEAWESILPEVLKRWLLRLAESPARYLIVNLEDLWLEDSPQNVPGTTTQKPNWKQKMKNSFENISQDRDIDVLLGEVNRLRNH
ncbi:MAG: 4-alpha-glucanotransferase [Acidobacteriota bacterium]